MLSFELSAIDLILAVAVIVLLILFITRLTAKPPTEEKLLVQKESSLKKPVTEDTLPEEERRRPMLTGSQSQTVSAKCPFGFGYLRKLSKEASIPEECLGCSRMIECYSASE